MKVRLSVNAILSGGCWVSMGEPIEESELPPTLRKYIATGNEERKGRGGRTCQYVSGVSYRMGNDGHPIRDARTDEAEAANTQAQLEAENEVWNSIFRDQSERSRASAS